MSLEIGPDVFYPGYGPDGFGGAFVVAGKHYGFFDPEGLEFAGKVAGTRGKWKNFS